MLKRLFMKVNKERGSATVEAVIGFTGFLLVIFTILSLVNLCRAQMLISSAMDNAAKELSQYSYFYEMSGLRKFSEALGEKATVGRSDINDVIGSVDSLYDSVVKTVGDGKEAYTNIDEATKNGTLKWEDVQSTFNTIGEDKDAISEGVKQMTEKFKQVGDNPIAYMKSIVAIAGSGGLDLAKSHLIAAPLARMFVSQQFGGKDHADENLRNLGVVGGLDGMNFNMSSMFTTDHPDDICLVVFYELELFQLFGRDVLKLQFSKQSCTGGWLGGDNVQALVDPSKNAPTDAESGEAAPDGEGSTDETVPGEEGTPESTPAATEESEPAVQTDPTWQTGTFSGSSSVLYHASNNSVLPVRSTVDAVQRDRPLVFGDDASCVKADGSTSSLLYLDVRKSLEDIYEYLEKDDTTEVKRALIYTVYVPENIPDEEYEKLEDAIDQAEALIDSHVEATNGETESSFKRTAQNVEYEITIVKTKNKNYDYSGGGGQ